MSVINFKDVFDEINELSFLEANWDGEDALKLLPETITSSLKVAKMLEGEIHMLPDVTPENYGTVSFDWANESGLVHLEIGKTKYAMFAADISKTTATVFFDGLTENIETEILEMISAINDKLKHN